MDSTSFIKSIVEYIKLFSSKDIHSVRKHQSIRDGLTVESLPAALKSPKLRNSTVHKDLSLKQTNWKIEFHCSSTGFFCAINTQ